MTKETIESILKIKESFELPEKMKTLILDENQKDKLFDEFISVEKDLSFDWFNEYFQAENSDRKALKQDYTPASVCEIACKISKPISTVADTCAGSGGLLIKSWVEGAKEFYCIEFSKRVFPILLFNLSIRNVKATVINGDTLSKEIFEAYKLTPTEKYSKIEEIKDYDKIRNTKVDNVIINPPYSMKWNQSRIFFGFESPPTTKADYAFILDGIERLKDGGTLTAILPHGVLFRGARELAIRQRLIELGYFYAVIGLPDKLFMNTDIPVCIIQLKNNSTDTLFIDAKDEFKKDAKKNILEPQHIQKIVDTYKERKEIERFSSIVNFEKLQENDFNLNIPRYVDSFIHDPPVDIKKVMDELFEIDKEIKNNQKELIESVKNLVGSTKEKENELSYIVEKMEQMQWN